MKNENVLIIGLGNLGLRYLEAALKVKKIKFIYLYDQKKKIRNFLKLKFLRNRRVKIIEKISTCKFFFFSICIIATYAKDRSLLIKFLEKKFFIKNYIIEKVLEQSGKKIFEIKKNLNKKLKTTWVNLPNRTFNFYKIIKKKIKNKSVKALVSGNNWGMASNIFHLIDLYSLLFNSRFKSLSIKKNLEFGISKRKKFIEIVKGECHVFFENGSLLILKCYKSNLPITLKHHIYGKNNKVILLIDDILMTIKSRNYFLRSKIDFLSHYMIDIIKKILSKSVSVLPRFEDLYIDHANIIESIINSYNIRYKKNIKYINIT